MNFLLSSELLNAMETTITTNTTSAVSTNIPTVTTILSKPTAMTEVTESKKVLNVPEGISMATGEKSPKQSLLRVKDR